MTIRDSRFNVLGYIEASGDAGKLIARDSRFQLRGYYDPRTNTTRDRSFRVVGYGNLLASLLGERPA
jgi:hypothetical protein